MTRSGCATSPHIAQIEQFTSARTRNDIGDNSLVRSAILYQLAIVGEASGKLSRRFRSKHPEVDWRTFQNFRHEIIHEYGSLVVDIIWTTVTSNLPTFKAQILELLRTEFPS